MPQAGSSRLPRRHAATQEGHIRENWKDLDRVQVLGDGQDVGHRGCVNALSWSSDGNSLISGSDDTAICIWGVDQESAAISSSPHPMKLVDKITTGHRANIFSAKFMPNTSSPTVVTCAGDGDIRIFDLERLDRSAEWTHNSIWAGSGDATRVLRCHTDRTKRIATQGSAYLFMTVSEDGTVRQHDLRAPHRCRAECPDPLFRAPAGVDLYSLSVSEVAPYIFAVAGRTDCAFICDRRMPERQTPSWGPHTRLSGQIHCVRRLGILDSEWEKVSSRRGPGSERHITCVKMSPYKADEVICAFSKHSTSLFSIYDSPGDTSMRQRTGSVSSNGSRRSEGPSPIRRRSGSPPAPAVPTAAAGTQAAASTGTQAAASTASRATAPRATWGSATRPAPPRPINARLAEAWHEAPVDDDIMFPRMRSSPGFSESEYQAYLDNEEQLRLAREAEYDPEFEAYLEQNEIDRLAREAGFDADDDYREFQNEEEAAYMQQIEDERIAYEAYNNRYQDDEEDDDMEFGMTEPLTRYTEFAGVEVVLPRRSFRGAANIETVKDCNFLGLRADKVCSGSDDGNFFVWDKETGRLEGIWEGDGSVVNVMEQHPSLPLVAVSGIDNTVKMFAPVEPSARPTPSFSRTHLAESIIRVNMRRRDYMEGSTLGRRSLLTFLRNSGMMADMSAPEVTVQPPPVQCHTQ